MSVKMQQYFPAVEVVKRLEPEEVALFLVKHLCELRSTRRGGGVGLQEYLAQAKEYAGKRDDEFLRVVTEAWMWLEREVMLAPLPLYTGDLRYVTKRGEIFSSYADTKSYELAHLLPKGILDPELASRVEHLFLRGDYDMAVLQAFKEVEIRVREAAELSETKYGTHLMREAFKAEGGLLKDPTLVASGEQQAVADLFAGAIGLFKNPSSHREWCNDPVECAELILFADYLLRLLRRHERLEP